VDINIVGIEEVVSVSIPTLSEDVVLVMFEVLEEIVAEVLEVAVHATALNNTKTKRIIEIIFVAIFVILPSPHC
jgi:hypothetical protein